MTIEQRKNKNKSFLFIQQSSKSKARNFFRKFRKFLRVKTKTLKRLTIIVINLAKLYFVVSKNSKFTKIENESKTTTKSRILV